MAEQTRAATSVIAKTGLFNPSDNAQIISTLDDYPDATYDWVVLGTTTSVALFGFTAFDIPTGSTAITVYVDYYDGENANGNNNTSAKIRVGSTENAAATHNPSGTGGTSRSDSWANNPGTGAAWTVAQVNGTDGTYPLNGFGIHSTDSNPTFWWASCQIRVVYTPPSVPVNVSTAESQAVHQTVAPVARGKANVAAKALASLYAKSPAVPNLNAGTIVEKRVGAGGTWTFLTFVPVATTQYTDNSSFVVGTTYYYRLKSVLATGEESSWSSAQSVTYSEANPNVSITVAEAQLVYSTTVPVAFGEAQLAAVALAAIAVTAPTVLGKASVAALVGATTCQETVPAVSGAASLSIGASQVSQSAPVPTSVVAKANVVVPRAIVAVDGLAPGLPCALAVPIASVVGEARPPTVTIVIPVSIAAPEGQSTLECVAPAVSAILNVSVQAPWADAACLAPAPTITGTAIIGAPRGEYNHQAVVPAIATVWNVAIDATAAVSCNATPPAIEYGCGIDATLAVAQLESVAPAVGATNSVDIAVGASVVELLTTPPEISRSLSVGASSSLSLTSVPPSVLGTSVLEAPRGEHSLQAPTPAVDTTWNATVNATADATVAAAIPAISLGVSVSITAADLVTTAIAPVAAGAASVASVAFVALDATTPEVIAASSAGIAVDAPEASTLHQSAAPTVVGTAAIGGVAANLAIVAPVPSVTGSASVASVASVAFDSTLPTLALAARALAIPAAVAELSTTPTLSAGLAVAIPAASVVVDGMSPSIATTMAVAVSVGATVAVVDAPVAALSTSWVVQLAAVTAQDTLLVSTPAVAGTSLADVSQGVATLDSTGPSLSGGLEISAGALASLISPSPTLSGTQMVTIDCPASLAQVASAAPAVDGDAQLGASAQASLGSATPTLQTGCGVLVGPSALAISTSLPTAGGSAAIGASAQVVTASIPPTAYGTAMIATGESALVIACHVPAIAAAGTPVLTLEEYVGYIRVRVA